LQLQYKRNNSFSLRKSLLTLVKKEGDDF